MTDFRFPVEASQVMVFARAIGDEAFDRTAPPGAPVPPTFVMAAAQFEPGYPLRPQPGRPWIGSGAQPSGADPDDPGWLHAEQHFEYRRPVVVGDVLDVVQRPGRRWEKPSRGGGTLRFEERVSEYRDTWSGEPVVVARFVRVLPVAAGVGE
ncbi:hypothetical protein GCM10009836_00090 [Pseudonocardia ailaonensis]|uniref:FAS1-like dehydratase domain-containing protein n=1 Tax=Pseudonocardia ailaonensis TaxID=367279 RepID=A0ABN2MGJ6_9PSEU